MKPRAIEQAKVVADLMTRSVATLFEEDDLENIDEAMEKFHIRHVPVVDDDKLVGLITRADLRGISSSSLDPSGPKRDEELRKRLFVRDVMTANVRTVTPSTPILEATRVMRDEKIGCLPVVEADDRLVGIITSTDMFEFMEALLDQREKRLTFLARIPRPKPRGSRSDVMQPAR